MPVKKISRRRVVTSFSSENRIPPRIAQSASQFQVTSRRATTLHGRACPGLSARAVSISNFRQWKSFAGFVSRRTLSGPALSQARIGCSRLVCDGATRRTLQLRPRARAPSRWAMPGERPHTLPASRCPVTTLPLLPRPLGGWPVRDAGCRLPGDSLAYKDLPRPGSGPSCAGAASAAMANTFSGLPCRIFESVN